LFDVFLEPFHLANQRAQVVPDEVRQIVLVRFRLEIRPIVLRLGVENRVRNRDVLRNPVSRPQQLPVAQRPRQPPVPVHERMLVADHEMQRDRLDHRVDERLIGRVVGERNQPLQPRVELRVRRWFVDRFLPFVHDDDRVPRSAKHAFHLWIVEGTARQDRVQLEHQIKRERLVFHFQQAFHCSMVVRDYQLALVPRLRALAEHLHRLGPSRRGAPRFCSRCTPRP
jgi:hypothetical protein